MEHGPTDSTATLIRRLQDGDVLAREELMERCLPLLRRWARGRLPHGARDIADTDDLVQLAMMRALANISDFDSRRQGAFLAYLRTILMNASRDEIRKSTRRPTVEEADHRISDPRRGPQELALDQETRDAYEAALASLSDVERESVILRLEFGLPFAEVALETGRPSADAARKMVSRALTKLARNMATLEPSA